MSSVPTSFTAAQTVTSPAGLATIRLGDTLSAELVDSLSEHVCVGETPQLRAETVVAILECVIDAVGWRNEPTADPVEEAGLRRVLAAARRHRTQMVGRQPPTTTAS